MCNSFAIIRYQLRTIVLIIMIKYRLTINPLNSQHAFHVSSITLSFTIKAGLRELQPNQNGSRITTV